MADKNTTSAGVNTSSPTLKGTIKEMTDAGNPIPMPEQRFTPEEKEIDGGMILEPTPEEKEIDGGMILEPKKPEPRAAASIGPVTPGEAQEIAQSFRDFPSKARVPGSEPIGQSVANAKEYDLSQLVPNVSKAPAGPRKGIDR